MPTEEGTAGGGGEPSSSSLLRMKPSYKKLGDRQTLEVELRPGETTFVSWKKLTKDANKVSKNSGGSTVPVNPDPPAAIAHPNVESSVEPGQPVYDEVEDAPPTNRFSAVIEKIERLYTGKGSSDEEDLKNAPDDDQYDTEDSFIDDAELDEYFEVDNAAMKHDGFFVNRGKLECISTEPSVLPKQQPKKRRRKDLDKALDESDHVSNKHAKLVKATEKTGLAAGKNSSSSSKKLPMMSEHYEDIPSHHSLNPSAISSKKKSVETRMRLDSSLPLKVSNGDRSMSLAEGTNIERAGIGGIQTKDLTSRVKDASVSSDHKSRQIYDEKSAYSQFKLNNAKPVNSVDEVETYMQSKEKNGARELPDLNIPNGKSSMHATKTLHLHKRDGFGARPKNSILEKAIKELEKMVAESRPPSGENQDADTSSLAIKRRLPTEVKLKLAKVARLAQASHGKISKELISRLMSILGHLMQLRTLKRNLKAMISVSLSPKQEKDHMFQQMKKEVVEMIKAQASSLNSKVFVQEAGSSDDFQEFFSEEKGVKRKISMDTMLEDKICDLYDLFVDGLDEDAGPHVRRLYGELAALWPNGFMDNHGIRRAICRAKDRKRAMYSRRKDKIHRNKTLVPRSEGTVRVDGGSLPRPQYKQERLASDATGPVLALACKSVYNSMTAAVGEPGYSMLATIMDKAKQKKPKGSLSHSADEAKMATDGALTKKIAKRKPEQELDGTHPRSEKLQSHCGEERKSVKQTSTLSQKPNGIGTVQMT